MNALRLKSRSWIGKLTVSGESELVACPCMRVHERFVISVLVFLQADEAVERRNDMQLDCVSIR